MSSIESPVPQLVPPASFDLHFPNVPRFEEVRFDPVRCANLFMHPVIGIAERDLPRIHVYVRPDYKLAYPRQERKALRKAYPEDYKDAGSTEVLEETGPFGPAGDILMTIVYKADFNPNALLCHEAVHARRMLQDNVFSDVGSSLISTFLPKVARWRETVEEAEADRAMKNVALKSLRKDVIQIVRTKKK